MAKVETFGQSISPQSKGWAIEFRVLSLSFGLRNQANFICALNCGGSDVAMSGMTLAMKMGMSVCDLGVCEEVLDVTDDIVRIYISVY